jgi:hypothetical protein
MVERRRTAIFFAYHPSHVLVAYIYCAIVRVVLIVRVVFTPMANGFVEISNLEKDERRRTALEKMRASLRYLI